MKIFSFLCELYVYLPVLMRRECLAFEPSPHKDSLATAVWLTIGQGTSPTCSW